MISEATTPYTTMSRHNPFPGSPINTPHDTDVSVQTRSKPVLTNVLIPLGSVMLTGLPFFIQAVPWWVTLVVITYVGVIAVVALVPTVIRMYRGVRRRRVRRAMAEQYLPE